MVCLPSAPDDSEDDMVEWTDEPDDDPEGKGLLIPKF